MNRPVTVCEGVMLMMCAWLDRCNCENKKKEEKKVHFNLTK